MIRVLNIISDTNIGGAGRVILNYLRFCDASKFQTMVAIPRGSLLKKPLKSMGIKPYEINGMADRSYHKADVALLKELITQVKPDLVHTHGALSGRIAARRCHVPVIYSRHSAFPVSAKIKYPPGRWLNKLINEYYADHIIAVSPATRDNLTQGGISPKKITVVMNGVAPVAQTTPKEQAQLKAQLGIGADTFLFGIFARMEDYKGHLYLLHATKLLKERGYRNFQVLIAGTGAFEGEIFRGVAEMGVRDNVQLLGFRSDIDALLNLLNVQLNTSYGTEATSLALLEGMSLGLPSIVSDYGGNPFLIEDGTSGLVFPSQDSHALAKAMAQLMDSPEETLRLGRAAKEAFQRKYTGSVFAKQVEDIYQRVLRRKG